MSEELSARADIGIIGGSGLYDMETVRNLREDSDPLLMKPLAEGKLMIVGAYYELGTGRVDFFDRS